MRVYGDILQRPSIRSNCRVRSIQEIAAAVVAAAAAAPSINHACSYNIYTTTTSLLLFSLVVVVVAVRTLEGEKPTLLSFTPDRWPTD